MSLKTAQVFRDELASDFAIRLSTLAQASSFGTSGEARLSLGALTSDSDSVLVQIGLASTLNKDVLGLDQTVFHPHVASIVLEAGSTGATWATRAAVIGVLVARGLEVLVYERTHGTGVAYTDITAGNLKATIDLDLQYPQMAGVAS